MLDRTNIRNIEADDIGGQVGLVVSDLSFISLTVVMPALTRVCEDGGDIVLMIKPQFEVGKSNLGKNGVVRDPLAARRCRAPRVPVGARARVGHTSAGAEPVAGTCRQRRVLLLAAHRR